MAQAGVQRDLPANVRAKGFKLPKAEAVQTLGPGMGAGLLGMASGLSPNTQPLQTLFRVAKAVGLVPKPSTQISAGAESSQSLNLTQVVRHEGAHQVLSFQGQPPGQHHETIRAASFPRSGRGVSFGQLEAERVAMKVKTPEQGARAAKGRERLRRTDIRAGFKPVSKPTSQASSMLRAIKPGTMRGKFAEFGQEDTKRGKRLRRQSFNLSLKLRKAGRDF